MFYKIIVGFSVLIVSIVTANKNDDILVLDPRDMRLFESVWKLGFHSGRDNQKQLDQVFFSRANAFQGTEHLQRLHINDGPQRSPITFLHTPKPDNKFLKKMFTPEGMQKYFGDSSKDFISLGNDVDFKEDKKKNKKYNKKSKLFKDKRSGPQWHSH